MQVYILHDSAKWALFLPENLLPNQLRNLREPGIGNKINKLDKWKF